MASETEHLMGLQENRLATVKEEEEDKGRPSSWLEKKGWKDEVFGRVVLLGKRGVLSERFWKKREKNKLNGEERKKLIKTNKKENK